MKLLYDLNEEIIKNLKLSIDEVIYYAIPFELLNREITKKDYLIVTKKRLIIIKNFIIRKEYLISEIKDAKAEALSKSGVLVINHKDEDIMLINFSMRHMERVSYIAKGINLLIKGIEEKIESLEDEKYCEKCQRVLDGSSVCPKCEGKKVMLLKFLDLSSGYKFKFFLISFFMILASGITVLMPQIQKNFIDNVLKSENGQIGDVYLFIFKMVILTCIMIIINVLKNYYCVSLGAIMSMDLRKRLYYKVQTLSLSFINRRKPGEIMNRIGSDTTKIRNFMEEVFGGMISALFTMVVSLFMMFYLDFRITLYSIVLIVIVILITKIFWKKIFKIFHMQWQKDDKMRSGLQDILSGMRVVKSFGKEMEEGERFKKLTDDFSKVQRNNEVFWAIFYPILTFIMGVGSFIAIYFGGLNVIDGRMSIGELIQYVTYCGFLYGPLGWMTHLPRSVIEMLTSLNRIYDILDEKPDIKNNENSLNHKINGEIDFENVSFGYNTYEEILKDISFNVKKGEMIGLVGASGTGKSTLINLIMRLYDVNSGEILIDGKNIKDIKIEDLHSQIGVVLQENFLFSGSILENLKFAKADASYEEIIKASKAANAHDFICKMPDGYNTYVGENGYNLSGGERQRIAIARAILNNPKILILDEATSALDTESEYLIQNALKRLINGRTTFAIAHRLSTLRNADRIIVLDGHRIKESGTHDELIMNKSIYYNLVKAQLQMSKFTE